MNKPLTALLLLLFQLCHGSSPVFVANNGTGEIYAFSPEGIRTTFASGIGYPTGLAFDSNGNLFVSDYFAGTILKFTPGGARTTFATDLGHPAMLAYGPDGCIYTADRFLTGDIYKIALDGTRTTFGNVPGLEPWGMAFDSRGNLYIADNTSNVFKYTPVGTRSTFAANLADPMSIAIDAKDNIYVGVFYTGEIRKFNTNGTSTGFATGIADPLCLGFDADGNLFESDGDTPASIKRFANTGGILSTNPTTFVPGLNYPYGLAFPPAGWTGRPTLTVLKTNGTVRVAWPSSFGGWTLKRTTLLAGTGTTWSAISPVLLGTNGTEVFFIASPPSNQCFFRLSKP